MTPHTDPLTRLVQIPFPGFYHSDLTHALDREEEDEAMHYTRRDSEEESEYQYPEALRLDESELVQALSDSISYQVAFQYIAQAYVEAFVEFFREEGVVDGMVFESMTSPREYNFGTDRVFATVPLTTVKRWYEEVSRKQLTAMIRSRHTSYDGFYSFYTTDLDAWLAKPLDTWDHNELTTLMLARLEDTDHDEDPSVEYQLVSSMIEAGVFTQAFHLALDHDRFKTRRTELRALKAT